MRSIASSWSRLSCPADRSSTVAAEPNPGDNWRHAWSRHGRTGGGLAAAVSPAIRRRELPSVEAIADDRCRLVVEEARDLEVSGMLIPAERRIYLNAAESRERQRFTLAHELGHWVCQYLKGVQSARHRRAEEVRLDASAKALEHEANVFAVELLMPEMDVRSEFVAGRLDERFGVSDEAMHYSLGLVDVRP